MHPLLTAFLLHWGIISISLWVASLVFSGLRFENTSSLLVSALLFGFVNAILKPILILLTLPLTLLTLGLFLLVINALMLMLVSGLVRGFTLSGFWTAFFASIFIALMNLLMGSVLYTGDDTYWQPVQTTTQSGTWL
jgi:putative membrane protein